MFTMSSLVARAKARFAQFQFQSARRRQPAAHLAVEGLEGRVVPATLNWASTFGGTSAERVVAISSAGDGSNLVLVQFQGSVTVPTGSGPASFNTFGSQDLLVIRQGADGVISHAQQIGTTSFDQGAGLFQNQYGQVIVGWTAGLGPNGGADWAKSILDSSSLALLVTDYMGGPGSDYLRAIDPDTNGDMALGGSIENGFDADPSGAQHILSAQFWAGALVKLRYDGTFDVAGVIDGPNDQAINSVSYGGGYITIGGYIRGSSVDMDPSAGDQTVSLAVNSQKGFIDVLDDSTLVPQFFKILGKDSAGSTEVRAVVYDNFKTYAAGVMGSHLDVNNDGTDDLLLQGNVDAFAVAYDFGGNNILKANLGGTGEDYGTSLSFDSTNNRLLVAGYFSDTAVVPGTNLAIQSAGGKDGFLLQMKEPQGVVGLDHFGGSSDDYPWAILAVGSDAVIAGQFVGTTDLAPVPENSPASSNGSTDAFIVRWNSIVPNLPTPHVLSIDRTTPAGPSTNASSVEYTVTFSDDVTGVDDTDFALALSGVTASTPVSVSGSGSMYTVTVNGIAGSGSLGLNLTDNDSIIDSTSVPLGGTGTGNADFTGQVYTIDTDAPTVTINREAGQADPTNTGPISFIVRFNEDVTGFAGSDINFFGSTAGGVLTANVSGTGADYTVTVSGMTSSGNVVASIGAGAALDGAGNNSNASTSTDNSVAFDNVVPEVTINQEIGQSDPTNTSPIVFRVVFSKPVTGFVDTDVDLSASTVGGTLLKSVSGSGTDYTVSVTGMSGVGDVIASIQAGVAVDSAGNGNAASTSTDNEVAFNNVGSLQFTSSVFNTFEGQGSASITVSRLNGSEGAISVQYMTSGGSATSDVDFSATSGTLNWGIGETGDRTILVPVADDDSLSEGRESFTLTLSNPTDDAYLGAQSTTSVIISRSNGTTINGIDKKPQSTFTDGDGDLVTLKLGGKVGTVTYYLTNGVGPISEIELSGTDSARSTVSITTKKPKGGTGDVRVDIGEIEGTGVKSLSLGKADLIGPDGSGINLTTFTRSVTIGAIPNGADITLSGAPALLPKNLSTKITAGVIGDGTDISITDAPLGSLTATSIGVGTITAPSVGVINIKGKAKTKTAAAIPGDFKSNLTIAGTGLAAKVPALKSLRVAGTVSGSTIAVGGLNPTTSVGDVGSVSVGSFVNSRLFAGYSGADNGSGDFNLASTIGSFRVRGKLTAFAHSFVIASNFKNVSLESVDPNNAFTKFGFIYHSLFGALTVKSPVFKFDVNGPDQQDMLSSDFYVKKM